MANKLIYGKNCILLERNISFYEIPADIYLFFLIDPIKLTIIEHIDNESSQEHFQYLNFFNHLLFLKIGKSCLRRINKIYMI